MVNFQQSRCKWSLPSSELPAKGKSRKSSAVNVVSPIDKLPSVEREKLRLIRKYKAAIGKIVESARSKYVSNLVDLLVHSIDQSTATSGYLSSASAYLTAFAVRVPPTISDSAFVYSQILSQLRLQSKKSDDVVIRLRVLHSETLQLMFAEIAKKIAPKMEDLSACSFELLLKLLKTRNAQPYKLILLFENAEQIPIGVLSTAMQLFGQSLNCDGVQSIFILGVSSAESWHKLHSSLPLRACKNAQLCFLSASVDEANSSGETGDCSDADVDFVQNIFQDILLSERFPLKFGPYCAFEISMWLRDGRLSIATMEKLFHFIAQQQLFKIMAEDGESIIKLLPDSAAVDEVLVAPSRQRSGDVNIRGLLSRLQLYWIDVKVACFILRHIEEVVMANSFSNQRRLGILEIYAMTLDSNIAQTRWCNRLLMGIGTLSDGEFDQMLIKLIGIMNNIKEETKTMSMPVDQRPQFLALLDACIELQYRQEMTEKQKKQEPVKSQPKASQVFATPSAVKPTSRKTMMGIFGTPQASSVTYFEHQARLRAEIKAGKGGEEQPTTPSGGGHQRSATRQFSNQLRDWLFDSVPNKTKIASGDIGNTFFFDDILLLSNSFNPDMNELLSAGLSSKSIRQHLTLKVPAQSDFDVHVLFSVFTSSSSVGDIATTAPLSQWYAAFSTARRIRRRKHDAAIDEKEMQARFVSALDELETRGLLRYNPPRRTITKLFECEEDDEL